MRAVSKVALTIQIAKSADYEKVDPGPPRPLTPDEVHELDSYGRINGRMLLPLRCVQLWERELLWGAVLIPADPESEIDGAPIGLEPSLPKDQT